ncbi:MAG: gamma-glutamyl-gamma-aminobutyrate hydrolase family protein [Oceanibaculum nanhaiense]|uniref:gamma-glutamyl-gamma-aminobutyrate hydrolase family protein n=1 Tax=Oceanibaculum nanhaiense TaxID=1909734 RepID=UPI0025A4B5A4|nr:gamma-glutamyl-gamma-aminobutyrate hydrolase family protein [Oceanibaculum nanhaiense]MDM7947216.1 gamma-glutamyl-gamma-aminobutyrate hydrolase family protein [Oceanibaculum nanhaiense]
MAERKLSPLIAVTGPRRGGKAPRLMVHLAIRLAGGQPVHLRPGGPHSHDMADYDGVVITGGHDIDPVLYASQSEVVPKYDAERDALESAVIDDALMRGLPLLGICRGAQLLNVRLGGTLFQELRSRRKNTSNRWTILPLKTLLVEAESCLRELLGGQRVKINSLHNQGIDALGDGLIVSGRDLDGIVQGVEAPGHAYLIGVQWHPEFLIFQARQRRLFKALVEAAMERKQRTTERLG